ncbi:MAG TPA: YceI family protein [Candidatus Eisenbacteria bacterium]|jgi:polyisoprenoid-binding protein YceI|nr:YceI family protein [Candidatus Eisenbacteria bacterium]
MKIAQAGRGLGVPIVVIVAIALLPGLSPQVATASPQQGQAKVLALRVNPAQSQVHWTLGSTLHTVHGTFAVKGGAMRIDTGSGRAGGEIVIDAASGESGNDGRDKKMHREIIESAKFKEIAFRPDRVEGKVAAEGSVTVQIHGIFLLRGSEHEITVPVQAELATDHWKGTAKFNVPYIAWGLKSPSNFFLKADKTVDVDLELAGPLERSNAP